MASYILPDDGSARIVSFDLIESETHETVSEITSHPVETGVDITDHVRPQADRLSLVAYVTNQPIVVNPITKRGIVASTKFEIQEYYPSAQALLTSPGGALRFGAGAVGNAVGDLLGLTPELAMQTLVFPEVFNAIAETYVTLLELQKNAVLCTVITPIRFYSGMIIERVSAPRIAMDSGVSFQIDIRELRVVSSGQVEAPPVPVEPRGVPESAKGGQGAKPPEAGEDAVKPKSLALQIAQGLGAAI